MTAQFPALRDAAIGRRGYDRRVISGASALPRLQRLPEPPACQYRCRPAARARSMWPGSSLEPIVRFRRILGAKETGGFRPRTAHNGRARDMRPDFGIWLCGPMRHRSRTCSFALKNCCRNLSSGPNVAAFSWMSTLFRSSAPNGLFDGLIWPLKSSISAVRRRRDRRRPCQRRCAADMAVAIGHGMAGERGEVAGGLFELEAERAA